MTETLKYDEPVLTLDFTDEMSNDWLKGRRLKERAVGGEEAAQEELDRMENTRLVEVG